MSPQLSAAFSLIAETGRDLNDWWIIGSAAMTLAGVAGIVPQDIDVLCSRQDALRLREAWSDHKQEAAFRIASCPHWR